MREAFHVLESRGIINSYQGKGRFLRKVPQEEGIETKYDSLSKNLERCSMMEAYEVRQVLEVKAVELIIRNATEADIDEMAAACEEMAENFRESGGPSANLNSTDCMRKKRAACLWSRHLKS